MLFFVSYFFNSVSESHNFKLKICVSMRIYSKGVHLKKIPNKPCRRSTIHVECTL